MIMKNNWSHAPKWLNTREMMEEIECEPRVNHNLPQVAHTATSWLNR